MAVYKIMVLLYYMANKSSGAVINLWNVVITWIL